MAILPIVTYNDAVLREKATPVSGPSKALDTLIANMFDTMYNAHGVGLAAPQIGQSLRLFVIDADPMGEDDEPKLGKQVFINPEITAFGAEKIDLEEGCLSLPEIRDRVTRPTSITISYLNQAFEPQTLQADGWLARVIQHEYDHLEGVLFIDHLGSFRRRLLRKALSLIEEGTMEAEYPLVEKH